MLDHCRHYVCNSYVLVHTSCYEEPLHQSLLQLASQVFLGNLLKLILQHKGWMRNLFSSNIYFLCTPLHSLASYSLNYPLIYWPDFNEKIYDNWLFSLKYIAHNSIVIIMWTAVFMWLYKWIICSLCISSFLCFTSEGS